MKQRNNLKGQKAKFMLKKKWNGLLTYGGNDELNILRVSYVAILLT